LSGSIVAPEPVARTETFAGLFDLRPIGASNAEIVSKHHLPSMEPEFFDAALGMMVITYQTFVLRTPRCTILGYTCSGAIK
jgi:hypothetical protein